MQATRTKSSGANLLHGASGESLLMLMVMSNAAMQREIRRELDERSGVSSAVVGGGERRRQLLRTDYLRAA